LVLQTEEGPPFRKGKGQTVVKGVEKHRNVGRWAQCVSNKKRERRCQTPQKETCANGIRKRRKGRRL